MSVSVMRAMSLSELLDTSFGVYRRLFLPLVFISLATQAAPLAISVYVEMAGGVLVKPALWALSFVLTMLLVHIGTAASTFMIAETYLGGSLTAQHALQRAVPFIGRLIAVSLLSGLLMFVGLIALIVPGVIFLCGFLVAAPALVLENLPAATPALRRSWQLTRGFKGKIFGALMVAFLLVMIPTFMLGIVAVAAATATGSETTGTLAALLLTSVIQVMMYPFMYVVSTLVYYDLRVRKEAYDLEMLAAATHRA